MTPDEQMKEWLAGKPIHNTERDECCPDFSCCRPELLWDPEVRQKFVDGDDAVRSELSMMALANAIALLGEGGGDQDGQ